MEKFGVMPVEAWIWCVNTTDDASHRTIFIFFFSFHVSHVSKEFVVFLIQQERCYVQCAQKDRNGLQQQF